MRSCKNRPTLTIMCDYCADGLWWNGGAIDTTSKKLPRQIRFLKKRISTWQQEYEFLNKGYFDPSWKVRFKSKKPRNKKWLEEGRLISKKIRKIISGKVKVEYFNEETLNRECIRKSHDNYKCRSRRYRKIHI